MALGGEVDDLGHAVLVDGLGHRVGIADVAADEDDLVAQQIGQVGQVAGVGELVEGDQLHRFAAAGEHPHEVRPDEAGRAGDEERSHD